MKPDVKVKCPSDHYAGPSERIVEVFDSEADKGCLISIFRNDSNQLIVSVYRCDPGVIFSADIS